MNERTYEDLDAEVRAKIEEIAPIEIDEKVPDGIVELRQQVRDQVTGETVLATHRFSARNQRRLLAKLQAAVGG